jgi:hypothetical protein
MVTTTSTYHKQVVDHVEPKLTPSSLTEQVPSPPPTPENIVHTMPLSIEPDLDVDQDEDVSLRFRMIDNILGAAVPSPGGMCALGRVARRQCRGAKLTQGSS